jgi:hypothetical protein
MEWGDPREINGVHDDGDDDDDYLTISNSSSKASVFEWMNKSCHQSLKEKELLIRKQIDFTYI